MSYSFAIVILLLALILFIVYRWFHKQPNIFRDNLFFDNNGTTEMSEAAKEVYQYAADLGNASASYATEAQKIIQESNDLISKVIGSNDKCQIIYTSGASESNCTVLKSIAERYQVLNKKVPHFILSSYEHVSNLNCAQQLAKDNLITLSLVDPDQYGNISVDSVKGLIQNDTALVSIIHVNNETGNINDIKSICAAVKATNPNIFFHSDTVQSFAKMPIYFSDWGLNAISASFHKIHGPTGVGLLIIDETLVPDIQGFPLIFGTQNNGLRGGTMNISGIAASRVALQEMMENRLAKDKKIKEMKDYIIGELGKKYKFGSFSDYYGQPDTFYKGSTTSNGKEIVILGNTAQVPGQGFVGMSPNTLLLSIVKTGAKDGPESQTHFCNIRLKDQLLKEKVIISIGSACHGSSNLASHVLRSLQCPFIIRCGVIRISLSDYNNMSQVKQFCQKLIKGIEKN